jgi:hypothetical protein
MGAVNMIPRTGDFVRYRPVGRRRFASGIVRSEHPGGGWWVASSNGKTAFVMQGQVAEVRRHEKGESNE